jgi:hypothetical protein
MQLTYRGLPYTAGSISPIAPTAESISQWGRIYQIQPYTVSPVQPSQEGKYRGVFYLVGAEVVPSEVDRSTPVTTAIA